MRITVDRDSVAMGDDMVSHEHGLDLPDGATVAQLLKRAAPDVSVSGGSTWITSWNGEPFAVSSGQWRTGKVWDDRYRTMADLPAGDGRQRIDHWYWLQMDPDWLLAKLRDGHPLDREALEEQWRPIAAERYQAELRRREATSSKRYFQPTTIAALEAFGARIDLHNDTNCHVVVGDDLWHAQRSDSMTLVWAPERRGSLRPVGLAEVWMVTLAAIALTGEDRLPPPVVESEVRRTGVLTVTRDVGDRRDLAQMRDDADVELFQRTLGRTVEDVLAAYGKEPAPQKTGWRHRLHRG